MSLRLNLWRKMRKAGWTRPENDGTLRARVGRGLYDTKRWYDWGHMVMSLTGRYEHGSVEPPRGRDLWWVPTEYVEGLSTALVAGLEVRHGCYVTTRYKDIKSAGPDVDWRIFDLQDDGHTVKVGQWPNLPEHNGRIQPLPWNELKPKTSLRLFLHWYLIDHLLLAQWLGLRRWAYYKGLRAVVNDRVPFSCAKVPPEGGYKHWTCQRPKFHSGQHRYRNYVWSDDSRPAFVTPEVSG